ncbi:transmembrane amino acid transporter protein-domain-containing protein [Aspergillus tamarii]|uniref:Transmembrane amino acid transporter protein-domain-containing protein n=1 Tax=Aspergillus tamarii TaxID=41984 RepID=A0A5N6UJ14_ASPTM|nr:transmembrane amino acid transporter protein-domain-containing protein [Aspergillus tamarii]
MLKTKEDPNELAPVPSQAGELREVPTYVTDDVFGEVTENGPNYRNVGWIGTVALMMKTQIGLGVLSIPTAFDTLGIVPGIICLCAIAVITTWSDYMIGAFKLRHGSVFSIDDVDWIFVSGSGMLSLSIGLNAVSTHGVCTAVFVAVAAILGFMFSSIRTLGHITWLAWIGLVCILTAILMVTIAVGVEERPASAPKDGVWVSDFKIVNNPSFSEGITAVSSLVFAYSGTPGFFNIVSEMRDPRHYTRSLIICQAGVTAIYITIGCVVYYYCGSYVASPALGSAGPMMKKISYGFALPGLLVTTTLVTHIPAKYIFIRILRGSRHLTANSLIHWGTWLGCTFGITLIAYVIASAIPVFNSLVSLIGALLGTLMSFQPMGCMWLYDNWSKGRKERSLRWMLMVSWSVFVIVIGTFLMVAGTYGCVVSIIDTYNASGGSAAWSCADNSNST